MPTRGDLLAMTDPHHQPTHQRRHAPSAESARILKLRSPDGRGHGSANSGGS
jgi:hypothetical protein